MTPRLLNSASWTLPCLEKLAWLAEEILVCLQTFWGVGITNFARTIVKIPNSGEMMTVKCIQAYSQPSVWRRRWC